MRTRMRRTDRSLSVVTALALGTTLTAGCSDDAPAPAERPGDDGTFLEVVTPTDGEQVGLPFQVQVNTNVVLGETEDERHHLHLWFGDNQSEFDVATSTTAQVEQAPGGATTLWVQVHTFEHQPASEPVPVSITVGDGGTGGGDQDDH